MVRKKNESQPSAPVTVAPIRRVQGQVTTPGDKSISHRYAMLTALSDGTSEIWNYSQGQDCDSTLACLSQLCVAVTPVLKWHADPQNEARPKAEDEDLAYVVVEGRGPRGLQKSNIALDCGNSGSTMRMMTGIVAAHPFETILKGDRSLSRRPMQRVTLPMLAMGAVVMAKDGKPPIDVFGADLKGTHIAMEVASAQVKSAVLFAGLQARGVTSVTEPQATRDHTERAFRAFGVQFTQDGTTLSITGGQTPRAPKRLDIPGDPSSAAFWGVAAATLPGSDVEIVDVSLNPTRLGWVHALERAGVQIEIEETRLANDTEPMGRIRVRPGEPKPLVIKADEVPGLIDELPVLAAWATQKGGHIHVTGAADLRHKESDRITALCDGLRAMGAYAEELPDGFVIHTRKGRLHGGVTVDAAHDHRLAMAFAIATLGAEQPVDITGAESVAISYPKFFDVLARLAQ